MSEELTMLPCPACGEEADIFDSFERDGKGHVAIGWSAYCTRGCLTTSEHGSREKAAASWNALPRALEWTDEPPKVPGCYLGRKKGGRISMVIYCFYQKDELGFWNGKKFCTFEQDATEYFGPIPEPREPKE